MQQPREINESGRAEVHAIAANNRTDYSKPYRGRSKSSDRSRNYTRQNDRNRNKTPDRRCRYCNGRHDRNSCPAYGQTCHKCKNKNHFASVCKSKAQFVNELASENEILALNTCNDKRIFSKLEVCGRSVRLLLDSAATANLLPLELVNKFNVPINATSTKLRMYDGTALKTAGAINVNVKHPRTGQCEMLTFFVTVVHKQPLIGKDACVLFDLIKINEKNICSVAPEKPVIVTLYSVTDKFSDLFEGIGLLPGEVHLETDSRVPPVRMPLRKLPITIKERVRKELQKLESNSIIEPVKGPTSWLSALLVVNKPSGDIRLCIDPKPLNKALQRDHFLMPTIDDVLPKLTNAKIFSTVDASNAFWHIKLDDESSMLTAFETPFGKYKWLRMPYGISPAPEIFQRKILETLSDLRGIACIADDILIYGCGETLNEARIDHDRNLIALLQRCREQNIKLNRDKMKLHRTSVKFMGHELTSSGIHSDPEKS